VARKGKKSTSQEAAAGQQNLEKWLAEHPSRGNLRHGAYSVHIRKRYDDGRTANGKKLALIMADLVADLGGAAALTAPQRLLLENIRSKLIVLFQISRYIATQKSIITPDGSLLPCLRYGFTTFSEACRRDLEVLFGFKRKRVHAPYDKIIKDLERLG